MERNRGPVLTPGEVAGYLHLRKDTVYRYIREGKLAAVRLGRYYRVSPDDLDLFLLSNRTGRETGHQLFQHVLATADHNNPIPPGEVERDVQTGAVENRGQAVVQVRQARAFTERDSLWNIVGIADAGPGDVSENKHKYLADAYADLHE